MSRRKRLDYPPYFLIEFSLMCGSPGCMPDTCEQYKGRRDALAAAISLGGDDFPRGGKTLLRQTGIITLTTGEILTVQPVEVRESDREPVCCLPW